MEYLFVYALGCAVHHLACTVRPRGVQEWGKYIHSHVWSGEILWKWECYIGHIKIMSGVPGWQLIWNSSFESCIWLLNELFYFIIVTCKWPLASCAWPDFAQLSPIFLLIMNLLKQNKDKERTRCTFCFQSQINWTRTGMCVLMKDHRVSPFAELLVLFRLMQRLELKYGVNVNMFYLK